jgi:hypothetical protein
MFRRKSLLTKSERSYLWAHWWSSANRTTRSLQDDPREDIRAFIKKGAEACDMVDEFYDSIVWLETL